MNNIKLTIAYDGTAYHGWQKQPYKPTIQGILEETIETLFKEKVTVQGASRTDAGVHALGQVAHCTLEKSISKEKVQTALNGKLPQDIVIVAVENVSPDFNARFMARGKHYRYIIDNTKIHSPFERNFLLFFPQELEVEKMRKAAEYFVGTHDFASFGVNPKRVIESTVRTIESVTITQKKTKIYIDIKGDSFLYKMVRTMVGTLLEIGRGSKRPESIKEILKKKQRIYAGKTAAACGLYLIEVFY